MTLVNVRRYRDVVLTAAALGFLVLLPFLYWQFKLTSEATREAIYNVRNLASEGNLVARELKTASNQIKLASFELRPQLKALAEDLNSDAQQRARLATMRSGESFARAGEEAALAAQEFRLHVLPRYAALPNALAREMARAVDELPPLANEGRGVLSESRKAVESVNKFIESPQLQRFQLAIQRILVDSDVTLDQIKVLASDIAQAAQRSDAIATQIEGVLVDARKSLQASARTLDAGTKTLGTIRKTTWISVLVSLAGLLRP